MRRTFLVGVAGSCTTPGDEEAAGVRVGDLEQLGACRVERRR